MERLLSERAEFPKIFMACGLGDSLLGVNEDFADYLKQKGIKVSFETAPGAHEWDFWDTYIKKILDWLPLEGKKQGMNSGNVGI